MALRAASRDDRSLLKQLELLPRAQISTFHSFALEVIKRYFHLTGLEPGFRILDEGETALITEEALDELSRLMQGQPGREVILPHTLVRMKYEDIIK